MPCQQNNQFGLNVQSISGVRGMILDISIKYGGATLDCLAFEASDLHLHLENGLLKEILVLFGENAYLNSPNLVTPFASMQSGGSKLENS